jgi:hypothetical protein
MAGTRISCPGCPRPITIVRVDAGEDDTDPWRVTAPPGHSTWVSAFGTVTIRCSAGTDHIIAPSMQEADKADSDTVAKSPEDQLWDDVRQLFMEGQDVQAIAGRLNLDPETVQKWIYTDGAGEYPSLKGATNPLTDTVEHETWLEYHDRLVREYFDGERELIKEIHPDRPEPAVRQEDPVFGPLARHTVRAAAGLLFAALFIGFFWLLGNALYYVFS